MINWIRKQRACLWLIMLLALVGSIALPPVPTVQAQGWVIIGDTVLIDTKDVYLSATPHTLYSSGWVEIEFRSKKYDSVDIVLGFPGDDVAGYSIAQLEGEKERTYYTYEDTGETEQVYDNVTGKWAAISITTRVPHTETYIGWIDTAIENDYSTMSEDWKRAKLKDKLTKGKLYRARVWVDVPVSTEAVSGKYNVGLLPWDKTVAEAESMGLLFLLDPWYNTSWLFRKQFNVTGSTAGAQTDYVLSVIVHKGSGTDNATDVFCDNHCLDNFGDIRFANVTGEDMLDYYLKDYVSGDNALFYFECDDIVGDPDNSTFYMYYGNAGATTTSSGHNTYQAFNDGTSLDNFTDVTWTGDGFDWSVESGYIKAIGDGGEESAFLYYDNAVSDDYRVEADIQCELGLTTLQMIQGFQFSDAKDTTHNTTWWRDYLAQDRWEITLKGSATLSTSDHTFDASEWHHYRTDKEGSNWTMIVDGDEKVTRSEALDLNYVAMMIYQQNSAYWTKFDNFTIAKLCYPEPAISWWGTEESVPVLAAPTDFTITQSGVGSIDIEWTTNVEADTTIIVVGTDGSCPASITDGWIIYEGNGTTASYGSLDLVTEIYCVRAWSNSTISGYSDGYAEGRIGGEGMQQLILIILPIALMAVGFWQKKQALLMAAGLAWVGFGVFMRLQSAAIAWANWDVYMLLFWLGIALALVCFFETWFVARKSQVIEQAKEEGDQYLEDFGAMQAQVRKMRSLRRRR